MVEVMMINVLLIVLSSLVFASAPEGLFKKEFERFPVAAINLKSKSKALEIKSAKAKKYQTAITQSWKDAIAPNFARKYFVPIGIGCGTGCSVVFVIDWETGEVMDGPKDSAFSVHSDSRLIVYEPFPEGYAAPPELYEFSNKKFNRISESKPSAVKKELSISDVWVIIKEKPESFYSPTLTKNPANGDLYIFLGLHSQTREVVIAVISAASSKLLSKTNEDFTDDNIEPAESVLSGVELKEVKGAGPVQLNIAAYFTYNSTSTHCGAEKVFNYEFKKDSIVLKSDKILKQSCD